MRERKGKRDMENNGKAKKRMGMKMKLLLSFFLIGACIAVATILGGTKVFINSIMARYTEMAYQVAQTATDFFEEGQLKEYAELANSYVNGDIEQEVLLEIGQSEEYQKTQALVRNLQEKMNANDVFFCVFDKELLNNYSQEAFDSGAWNPICYIMDTYHIPEENYQFGDRSRMLPEFVDTIRQVIETGEVMDGRKLRKQHKRFLSGRGKRRGDSPLCG